MRPPPHQQPRAASGAEPRPTGRRRPSGSRRRRPAAGTSRNSGWRAASPAPGTRARSSGSARVAAHARWPFAGVRVVRVALHRIVSKENGVGGCGPPAGLCEEQRERAPRPRTYLLVSAPRAESICTMRNGDVAGEVVVGGAKRPARIGMPRIASRRAPHGGVEIFDGAVDGRGHVSASSRARSGRLRTAWPRWRSPAATRGPSSPPPASHPGDATDQCERPPLVALPGWASAVFWASFSAWSRASPTACRACQNSPNWPRPAGSPAPLARG